MLEMKFDDILELGCICDAPTKQVTNDILVSM